MKKQKNREAIRERANEMIKEAQRNIDIQNDKLHGRYPMTLSKFNELIEMVPADIVWQDSRGFMSSARLSFSIAAELWKDDPEKLYECYRTEMKRFIKN